MRVLLKIHFIILAILFITKSTLAKPACAVCTSPVASTHILGIPENIFYILLFSILFLIFCITLYLFKHKNIKQSSSSSVMEKKDELEKLFRLKEKGTITEEEFNQKREEYLSSNIIDNRSSNVHFYTMLFLSILLVALIFTGFYYSKVHSAKSEMENGLGKKGFSVKLECAFNMAGMYTEVPLEGCTRESQVVIFYDNDRKDYSGYGIPSYFDLPQHFQLKVWNGHDKFSLMMVITDRETNKAIAKREISPHSWDAANN